MDSGIFRKVALDRLSSPEQLDQVLTVTSPKEWAALIGLLALLGVGAMWGFGGSVPTKVEGQAVLVRSGTVSSIVAMGSGLVLSVSARVGDRVSREQVVATVAQPAVLEKIRLAQQALAAARRERDRQTKIAKDSSRLQVEALQRKRTNTEREIAELNEQAQLASAQIPVQDQLLAKGLATKQQAIAARQKLTLIQDEIAGHQAQLKEFEAEEYALQSQPQQTFAQAEAAVRDQERSLAELTKELDLLEKVISPYDGEIIEVKADPGAMVEAGAPIFSIQPDVKDLEVLAYLPSRMAKSVHPHMKAEISPSTVKREEYGFLKGEIDYVADYPATTAALMRNFQNESLVRALSSEGPVTEVHVRLLHDDKTMSGFSWSSRNGPPIKLSSGTIGTIEIITREQRPISLLFPYSAK